MKFLVRYAMNKNGLLIKNVTPPASFSLFLVFSNNNNTTVLSGFGQNDYGHGHQKVTQMAINLATLLRTEGRV